MVDGDDRDHPRLIIDLVGDPEVAPRGAALARKVEAQLPADTLGVVGQRAIDELDGRGRRLLGPAVQAAKGRTGPGDLVRLGTHILARRARMLSRVSRSTRPAFTSRSPLRMSSSSRGLLRI